MGSQRVGHDRAIDLTDMWIGTWPDSEKEPLSCALVVVELLLGGISSGLPLYSHLDFLVCSPCLVYLRILPWVRMHLLAKMDSTEKA